MMCKNYNNGCRNVTRASAKNSRCWRMWQLCGVCAVREHPEAYKKSYVVSNSARLNRNPHLELGEHKEILGKYRHCPCMGDAVGDFRTHTTCVITGEGQ